MSYLCLYITSHRRPAPPGLSNAARISLVRLQLVGGSHGGQQVAIQLGGIEDDLAIVRGLDHGAFDADVTTVLDVDDQVIAGDLPHGPDLFVLVVEKDLVADGHVQGVVLHGPDYGRRRGSLQPGAGLVQDPTSVRWGPGSRRSRGCRRP